MSKKVKLKPELVDMLIDEMVKQYRALLVNNKKRLSGDMETRFEDAVDHNVPRATITASAMICPSPAGVQVSMKLGSSTRFQAKTEKPAIVSLQPQLFDEEGEPLQDDEEESKAS